MNHDLTYRFIRRLLSGRQVIDVPHLSQSTGRLAAWWLGLLKCEANMSGFFAHQFVFQVFGLQVALGYSLPWLFVVVINSTQYFGVLAGSYKVTSHDLQNGAGAGGELEITRVTRSPEYVGLGSTPQNVSKPRIH